MQVHHLNCGTIYAPFGVSLFGTGGLLRRARAVTHCILAETGDGLLLVDTGLGMRDYLSPSGFIHWMLALGGSPRDVNETAYEQVGQLGYDPAEVRHIALTHFHYDHAGGLPDFPHAKVHIYKTEYEAVTQPDDIYERYPYRPEHWEHKPLWEIHASEGDQWYGFNCTPLVDLGSIAFLFVPLPGHTRGHCAVALRIRERWLLHCGDAYTFHGEVDPISPRMAPYSRSLRKFVNLNKAFRNIGLHSARLRTLVAEHGDEVELTCTHDPRELEKFILPKQSFDDQENDSGGLTPNP